VKEVAAVADRLRRPPDGIVVLIYHRVGGGTGSEVDLHPTTFEDQVRWLAERGRAVGLDDAIDALAAGTPLPPTGDGGPPVVVTFDDGTEDFARVATPILERHQVPATLYAATAFLDEGRAFPGDGTPLTWAALRDAHGSGVISVGSHTHEHRLLDRLPDHEVDDELDRSIERIATHLGVPPQHFAYPKAVLGSPAARAAVAARFRSAAVAGTRANPAGSDVQRLARSPIQVGDSMAHFARKAAGGMGLEDDLRRVLNRRRYASATT
jgi:peptidoglycan/xylan/chitin deacetylase (PgdA/CDA1 family)